MAVEEMPAVAAATKSSLDLPCPNCHRHFESRASLKVFLFIVKF